MTGLSLPLDRRLTVDEARGFRMGMYAVSSMATTLAASARRCPDADPVITHQTQAEFMARAVAQMTEALDRTYGRGGPPTF